MEDDDDEFGDLYTDVLRPLTSFSTSQPPPIQSTPPSLSRPIDINIQSDHEGITSGAPNSKFTFNFSSSSQNYDLVSDTEKTAPKLILSGISDSHRNLNVDDKLENQEVDKKEDLAGVGNNWASDSIGFESRVLESGGGVKLQKRAFEDLNFVDESGIDIVVDEGDDKDGFWVEKDEILAGKSENFDVKEVDTEIGDLGSAQIIPGLSIPGVSDAVDYQSDVHFATRDDATGEGDDWDSDSEDDLQIVLNDNNHGPMAMDGTGVIGTDDDDEDEDGDPLVIVADSDPNHQPINEQEWGEDAAQGTDGERKELGDAAKVNGVAVAPKIGYSNHGYHPFHSQFKVSDVVHVGFCVFPLFDENWKCKLDCNCCTKNMVFVSSMLWKLLVIELINVLVYAIPYVIWKYMNKRNGQKQWDLLRIDAVSLINGIKLLVPV